MYSTNIMNTALQANTTVGSGGNKSASGSEMGSWYEAMANAWGDTLDNQANKITEMADQIGNGGKDNPKAITELTAESMRMQFISSSASTSITSVGQALESLARK